MKRTVKALVLWALGIVAVTAMTGTALAEKRVALVVGNDAYREVPVLRKAVGDARAMARVLERLGYDVIQALNADRSEMSRRIFEFTERIEPNDEALFFFAGHGVRLEGRNYLLPVDVPKAGIGGADLVIDQAFAADDIGDRIRRRSPRVNVMILDACRDNPFQVAGADGTRAAFGETRGLARMATPVGTFIMFSAGEGERALDRLGDDDGDPNSVFTRHLIRELAVPGRSLLAIAKDVQSKVYRAAKRVPHDQAPAFYDRILGDYCLAPDAAGACGVAAPSPTPAPITKPAQSACRDLLFDQAMQIGTEAALVVFLESCKEGPPAALAAAALAKLRDEAADGEAESRRRQIRDFVRFDYLGADFSDTARLRQLFAPRVEYFGRGVVTADAVVADKRAYASRWNSLDYALIEDSLDIGEISKGGDRYRATFRVRFQVADAKRAISGISETTLTLGLATGRPMIEGESGRVIERKEEAIAPPADQVVRGAGGEPAASFWNHNGSIMYLIAEGDRRRFHYERPRSGIRNAGAEPGSLLFDGRKTGDTYEGTAYVFSARCGSAPYRVSGRVENGSRRVVLFGHAPTRDTNCNVIRYEPDRLVFDYMSMTRP